MARATLDDSVRPYGTPPASRPPRRVRWSDQEAGIDDPGARSTFVPVWGSPHGVDESYAGASDPREKEPPPPWGYVDEGANGGGWDGARVDRAWRSELARRGEESTAALAAAARLQGRREARTREDAWATASAEASVDRLADELRAQPVTRGDVLAGGLDPGVPRSWVRVFNYVLGAVALVAVVGATSEFLSIEDFDDPEIKREKMRIIGSTVSLVGALLWPALWDRLAGYAVVVHHPLTIFAFLWPLVVAGVDLVYSASARNPAEQARIFGLTELSTDANTLIGVAFAVGSLLASQANRQLADATVPLLMYALLFLIAFIVPTPTLNPNDYSGFAVGAIQRTSFNYALGLVIAGISINVSAQSGHSVQSALRNMCLESQTVGPSGDLDAEAAASVRQQERRHGARAPVTFGGSVPWFGNVLNCPRARPR